MAMRARFVHPRENPNGETRNIVVLVNVAIAAKTNPNAPRPIITNTVFRIPPSFLFNQRFNVSEKIEEKRS